jgi:hypothetical protein
MHMVKKETDLEATTTPNGNVPPHPSTWASSQMDRYLLYSTYFGKLRSMHLALTIVIVTCYSELQ